MEKYEFKKPPVKLSKVAVLSFLLSLSLCSLIISKTVINRIDLEKMQMEQLILEKTIRINDVISRLLYKTDALAALVVQGGGSVENFDKVAPSIAADPSILNVLLAPDGVVSKVYPLKGNEAVIGLNFFNEGAGNREAAEAKTTGRLVLGGPFNLIQGGSALVGRLPVYIDTEDEKQKFWGIVSVTLKYPQVLDNADIGALAARGFSYELWRINPDDNERQIISSDYSRFGSGARFIEKNVSIINASWYLRVWPIGVWYKYPESLILIIAGFFISLLVLFVAQNNHVLKRMKCAFEDIAKTDPLTGIHNRRYFMEILKINIERARRIKTDCYIILFDLDRFKSINDTYGHITGDKVLIETTKRIKAGIRPYDLFARYGGEEFIIFVSDIEENSIEEIVERLRLSICGKPFKFEDTTLDATASFGVTRVDDIHLEKMIKRADQALYTAKKTGRNRVVFEDK